MDDIREKERRAARKMGIASGVLGIVFLIVWCGLAAWMGAWIMLLFGIPMLIMLIYRLVVSIQLSRADGQKKPQKEADPWDRPAARPFPEPEENRSGRYCPYCGCALEEQFAYCPQCGRKQDKR